MGLQNCDPVFVCLIKQALRQMASKRKLIINCAATHVSAAEFAVSNGKLVLESFKVHDLHYDYSVAEAWLPEVTVALRVLGIKGKATVIAPAMMLLTKTIKVPHVDGGRQDEVIRFEAEKNIPYDLNDVSWDYQKISDDGVEMEILLTSIKSTSADDLCAAVQAAGVVPDSIDASSVLDYNTWRYCGLENDVILLDVGARFSNMIVARDNGLFVRSIPVGGNSLTQSIADSMGNSFGVAEDLKIKYFNSQIKENAGVAGEYIDNNVQSMMRRISLELKRSIVNYRRTGRVESPKKIYLSGRGALVPGFAEFLAEDQKMSVEYLDALSNVAVAPGVDQSLLSACAPQVSALVGEAVRMVLPDAHGVNLLPRHIVEETAFARKRPLMVISAALLALATVPPFMMLSSQISEMDGYEGKLEKITPELVARADALKANQDKVASIKTKIEGLEGLANSKSNWINLFIDIERRLMEQKDVWLDTLKVVRNKDQKTGAQEYRLELSGRFLIREFNPKDPDAYDHKIAVKKINDMIATFTDSQFLKSYDKVTTDPSNPRILKFSFVLVVNPDKPI